MGVPSGWAGISLGDLSEVVTSGSRGWAEHYVDQGPIFIRVQNLQRGSIRLDLSNAQCVLPPEGAEGQRTRLRRNDILISITADLGRVGLFDDDSAAYVNQHVALVRLKEPALGPAVALYLTSEAGQYQLGLMNRGITRAGLGLDDIRGVQVPIPPLPEQGRIVAKLDALTARVARARAELDGSVTLAKRMQLAELRAVFQSDAQQLPCGWVRKRLDEVGAVQLGRQRSPKDHAGPHMRPYVRAANITWSGWDLRDVKYMNFTPDEFETFHLKYGDVLLNEGSGSAKEVGKPAVWRGEVADVCFQNTLLRIRPHKYNAELLRYCLLYFALSGQFVQNTQGVNIIHIGKAGLARFIVPVPPDDQQDELVQKLDAAFARADRLEAEATRARALLDRLEAALFAKAFRGELVPQDPNDEPASVLLDRISASRAAGSKPRRERQPRAASAPRQPRAKAAMTKTRTDSDVRHQTYLANLLREVGGSARAEALFRNADLSVADFYKQLAWEIEAGHIKDGTKVLEAA